MMIRQLFFLLSILLPAFSSYSYAENTSMGFPERMEFAKKELFESHAQKTERFEALIRTNPDEIVIYDEYAGISQHFGFFDRARSIYERALANESVAERAREYLEDSLKALEKRRDFYDAQKGMPSWSSAKVVGTLRFAVKTNLPVKYQQQILSRLHKIYSEEKSFLDELFKKEAVPKKLIELYIFGRPEEYNQYNREVFGAQVARAVAGRGYYDHKKNRIIIYYNGVTDWITIAHQLAYYMMENFYTRDTSSFFNEGMADYLAYRFEKTSAPLQGHRRVAEIHRLLDYGEFESVMDLFKEWKAYKRMIENPHNPEGYIFYLRSFTIVHFFVSTQDAVFQEFFRKYIRYEVAEPIKTAKSTERFFRQNLSTEDLARLDQEWRAFVSDLTFESL